MRETYHLGMDVGSTTVKMVVLDKNSKLVFSDYRRHYSDIKKPL
ncbi:hypothetical protein N3C_0202 [Clostridium sp. N3C]|nr:hypothetical protein N3C_0202 [Clostridium sp. N3C]